MLVICNGAFKSGSTWTYEIARHLVEAAKLPREFQEPSWEPVCSVSPRLLRRFMSEVDFGRSTYVVKQHLQRPVQKRLVLGVPDVKVIDVRRNMADVVYSAYHHFRGLNGRYGSFEDFYWRHGRYVADSVRRYHRLWSDPQVVLMNYEDLVLHFDNSVRILCSALGVELNEEQVEGLASSTSLTALRRRYASTGMSGMSSDSFFRRGIPGDGAGQFNEEMGSDLTKVETQGIPLVERGWWLVRKRVARGVPK